LPKEQASVNICATSKSNIKQLNLYECIQEKTWNINDSKAHKFHYLIGEMLALDNEAINMI